MPILLDTRNQPAPRIWTPDDVGAWVDRNGKWHYTLIAEPLLSISKPLDVECAKCKAKHTFQKAGSMQGWKPPKGARGWLCPTC